MGQWWAFYNLDKHQQRSGGKLHAFFFSNDELGKILTRPAQTSFMIHCIEEKILPGLVSKPKTTNLFTKSKTSTILEKFPNEILNMICGCIEGLDNIAYFALTCPQFWGIAKPHIMRARDALIAERLWAGDRIMCGGGSQDDDDWPPSIPKEEYESYLEKTEWSCGNADLLELEYQKYYRMSKQERKAYKYICETVYDDDCFVLRNMSKRLYVDERGIDELMKGCSQTRPKTLRLGHIALSKICWSSDPQGNINYGPVGRGEWAGDRLEIVSLDRHLQEIEDATHTKGSRASLPGNTSAEQNPSLSSAATDLSSEAEWRDVTDECMKLIGDIWEADYGSNWKEDVIENVNVISC